MKRNMLNQGVFMAIMGTLWLSGCQSIENPRHAPAVTIVTYGANAVSVWNEIATNTITVAPAPSGTPEERRPTYAFDLATVNLAIYDAVIAIARTHQPYAITPTTDSTGASMEAAASAAAYGVLKGLFPSRSIIYQSTYNLLLATIPEGDAKTRGIALGAEVARGIIALRANDGRDKPLAPYVSGTAPGKFRSDAPINRYFPYVRPFTLTSAAQFRPAGPPALSSSAYAADLNETKMLGSANSAARDATQTEVARFHSEPPTISWSRNSRQFATSHQNLADNARLMAMIWVAHADAMIACFESKYHFEFWRPTSAIALAELAADPKWIPVVPTPNHPEYPAAHSCGAAATAETVRIFFGTHQVSFKFDSTVPGSVVHRFTTTDELVNEMQAARIHGGMHFRTATVDGAALGAKVARWSAAHHFQRRD